MRRIAGVAIAALLIASGAAAQGEPRRDGNFYLEMCRAYANTGEERSGDQHWPWCLGFTSGVAEGYDKAVSTAKEMGSDVSQLALCMPEDAGNVDQLVAMTVKYVEDNPEYRHFDASALVLGAMLRAWQCREEDGADE